ncbi:hypothetical protein [Arcicella rosea]|uniref:Uncharacterized protein n=1 Tax=Arcicella rosea TaxID=502909 RepID=A0A841EIM2_9BACT|nr:hypothetical protein [Arcicella rosea]MBB6003025.1 hypothetical protein [Arcicella rosea]
MYQDLHFYIDLDWEKYVEDRETYLSELYELINLAYIHRANVYYSFTQLYEFKNNCEDLDTNFTSSVGNQLEIILQDAISLNNQNHIFEICFAQENTSLNPIKNKSLASVQAFQKQLLISFSSYSNVFLWVKSNSEFERVTIHATSEIIELQNWIVKSSNVKNYNFSNKHGNDKVKANPPKSKEKVSQLLCSDQKAQELLHTAIPNFDEKKGWHYNFDETLTTFIVFPFEGETPQNQFHAFHVEPSEWHKEIPNSIRRFFGK